MGIWRYLAEHDNGVTNFHFEITADLLDQETIAFLHTVRKGLFQFEIGVQSTNPKTIEAINRNVNFEKLSGIVQQIKAGGNIHQHLDLIAGLPYETSATFLEMQCGSSWMVQAGKMHGISMTITKSVKWKAALKIFSPVLTPTVLIWTRGL